MIAPTACQVHRSQRCESDNPAKRDEAAVDPHELEQNGKVEADGGVDEQGVEGVSELNRVREHGDVNGDSVGEHLVAANDPHQE
jgi:hypothetical protein